MLIGQVLKGLSCLAFKRMLMFFPFKKKGSERKLSKDERITYDIPGDRELTINDNIWKPGGCMKIYPTRGFQTHNPNHYMYTDASTSNPQGYSWLEKKQKDDIAEQTGLDSENGECILETIAWDNYGKDRPSDKKYHNVRQRLFFLESGNSYFRKSANQQGTSWEPWRQLNASSPTSGITRQQADARYIRKLGRDGALKLSNLNTPGSESGIYKTAPNCQNTPIRSDGSTYGVIEVHFENATSGAGVQRWTSIAGQGKGRSWVRVNDGGGWQNNWVEITGSGGGGSSLTEDRVRAIFKEELLNLYGIKHT